MLSILQKTWYHKIQNILLLKDLAEYDRLEK